MRDFLARDHARLSECKYLAPSNRETDQLISQALFILIDSSQGLKEMVIN